MISDDLVIQKLPNYSFIGTHTCLFFYNSIEYSTGLSFIVLIVITDNVFNLQYVFELRNIGN